MIGQARSRDDILAMMQSEFNWGGLSTRFSRRPDRRDGGGSVAPAVPMVAVHQATRGGAPPPGGGRAGAASTVAY